MNRFQFRSLLSVGKLENTSTFCLNSEIIVIYRPKDDVNLLLLDI